MAEPTGWLGALQAAQAAIASGGAGAAGAIVATANRFGNAPAGNFGTLTQSELAQFGAAPVRAPAAGVKDWREGLAGWSRDADGTWRFTGSATGTQAAGTPVSTLQIANALGLNAPGSSPVATGFPLLDRMVDNLLRARADARAERQQQIDLARMLAELQRTSPTRAASMAAVLGIEGGGEGLAFSRLFGRGAGFPNAAGAAVSGTIGGTSVGLPKVFSGQELSFLQANPDVANTLRDVGDYLGKPDIFEQSLRARIPVMSGILAGGF